MDTKEVENITLQNNIQNSKEIEATIKRESSGRRKTVSLSDGAAFQWNVETADGRHTITVKTTESQLWDGCISMRGVFFDEKQVILLIYLPQVRFIPQKDGVVRLS